MTASAPLDLVAGPSGYGLPLTAARDLTDATFGWRTSRADGEAGGIGGLRSLMRALARARPCRSCSRLASCTCRRCRPTAKSIAWTWARPTRCARPRSAVHEQAARRGCPERDVSFILLELGGAFTAAIAVEHGTHRRRRGRVVRSRSAFARRARSTARSRFSQAPCRRRSLFTRRRRDHRRHADAPAEALATPATHQGSLAWDAYLESAVKAVAAMSVAVPRVPDVILSGRMAHVPGICDALSKRLLGVIPGVAVQLLEGFAPVSKQAAQGAALIADGLAGGGCARLVDRLGIRDASGTVLDHLYVISPAAARARLGITGYGG